MIVLVGSLVFSGCGDPPRKGGPATQNPNNANNANNENNENNANNLNTVNNTSSQCGNGVLEPGESCDPGIEDGDGACPTSCSAPACTTVSLTGSADDCSARCEATPVQCINDDGCCPAGCEASTDNDCANVCGDGVLEGPELCDGDCPTTCDDSDACTRGTLLGDPATCSSRCTFAPTTQCVDDDGCCPDGCSSAQDNDCDPGAVCGNGIVEPGETCDGDCPTSCIDDDVCTSDRAAGSASTCNVVCENRPITSCINNDGCCPPGCTNASDTDCACTPQTCASLGIACGPADNGCNSTIDCGGCPGGDQCSAGQCVPQSTGDGEIGDPCQTENDCQGDPNNPLSAPTCLGGPGGYCSVVCFGSLPFPGLDCPAGTTCVGLANGQGDTNEFCVKDCNSSSDCRQGYSCVTLDGSSRKVCLTP